MNDLISRREAIDALGERPMVWTDNDDYSLGQRNQYDSDRLAIETVPPAEPERTGRWIFNQYDANPRIGNWHCSECGQITIMPHHVCNYCPYCGAKMEVEND